MASKTMITLEYENFIEEKSVQDSNKYNAFIDP